MKHRTRSMFFFGCFCAVTILPTAAQEPIHTRRTSFRIPFAFDKGETERLGAQEVQLFVSADRGKTWRHAQSASADAEKFRFSVAKDGEHWFAVRTLDRNHRLHPAGRLSPGLIVIVDTRQPEVGLLLKDNGDGTVKVEWSCDDTAPDLSTLKMDFKTEAGDWKPVSVSNATQPGGTTALRINEAGRVSVRLSISDEAGNTTVATRDVTVLPVVSAKPRDETKTAAAAPRVVPRKKALPVLPVVSGRELPERQPQIPVTTPRSVRVPRQQAVRSQPAVIPAPLPPATPIYQQVESHQQVESRRAEPPSHRPDPGTGPVAARTVNRLAFQLQYLLEDLGPSGVSQVEVFITEDNGRKWWRYGDDPDLRSPVSIRVPRQGTYGFAIRARSGAGLIAAPPAAGEAPDVSVVVDVTPPSGRVRSVQLVRSGHRQMVARYELDRAHPQDMVRVEYAVHLDGPWQSAGDWQANDGSAEWQLVQGLPGRIFVRLLARDRAGNIGRLSYPHPVIIDLARPRARIVSVGVAGESR